METEDVFRCANEALARGKREGGGRVAIFVEEDGAEDHAAAGVRNPCRDRRRLALCAVGPDRLLADLRHVERVGAPGAPIETFASFVVEDGRPGAVPA